MSATLGHNNRTSAAEWGHCCNGHRRPNVPVQGSRLGRGRWPSRKRQSEGHGAVHRPRTMLSVPPSTIRTIEVISMSALGGLHNFDGAPVDRDELAGLAKGLNARGPDGGSQVLVGSIGMAYRALQTNKESRLE